MNTAANEGLAKYTQEAGTLYFLRSETIMQVAAVLAGEWRIDASGDWNTAANWLGPVPNSVGESANFLGAISADRSVTVDAAKTVGRMVFENNNRYTITGSSDLTIAGSGSAPGYIHVVSGSHTITAPLSLTSNLTVNVVPAASTLTITSDVSAGAGVTLTKTGDGTLAVKNVRATGISVNAGAIRVLPSSGGAAGVSKTASVSVAAGAKLDLTDNKLVTASAIGTWNGSAYTGVTGLIASGRNGGVWDGPGVTTSMTDATSGSDYTTLAVATASDVKGIAATETAIWGGQTVTGSDTLVMYTYGGDANLSGNVDVDDYGQIDFNASTGGALSGWYNGDFDYSGFQDVDDYGIIDFVVNVQGPPLPTSGGVSTTTVPEPTAVLLWTCAGMRVLARRRQCQRCL